MARFLKSILFATMITLPVNAFAGSFINAYVCVKDKGGRKPALLDISDEYMELKSDPNRGSAFEGGSGKWLWRQKFQNGDWVAYETNSPSQFSDSEVYIVHEMYVWNGDDKTLNYGWLSFGESAWDPKPEIIPKDNFSFFYRCTLLH